MQCKATSRWHPRGVLMYIEGCSPPKATKQCVKISKFYKISGNERRAHYINYTCVMFVFPKPSSSLMVGRTFLSDKNVLASNIPFRAKNPQIATFG